ncbi:MAG: hypothetical protein Kow0089_06490 [Desulfobulbaceae bacterium]
MDDRISAEVVLRDICTSVMEGCVSCGLCRKDCRFLQEYGLPGAIAEGCSTDPARLEAAFECSLCGLCTAVCPKDIDPAAMFAAMRCAAGDQGRDDFPEHRSLLRYERWGLSPTFSWYGLPAGCDTVFFPGCAFAGSRSGRVLDIYSHLRRSIPSLGIVLDCCAKPSHDLGRNDFFTAMFGALRDGLAKQGIQKILVACPSCYRVWNDYGHPVRVATIYELLAEAPPPRSLATPVPATVHDPCATRHDTPIHAAVRRLAVKAGLALDEMKHSGTKTLCCGEGGAAWYLAPEFAGNWTTTRVREAGGRFMVTYCAGCTNFLGRQARVGHAADLFFAPEETLAGRVRITRSPFTWIARWRLKRVLRKVVGAAVTGTRDAAGRVRFREE